MDELFGCRFLVSFLFGLIHTSNFERMNARTHNNFETKKLRALISLVWTHERMNADIFGLNSIWTEPYLKLWTHERMNAQQFWHQKIWELWFHWFERTNAWTQTFLVSILFGLSHTSNFQRMNAWTHNNFDTKKFENSDLTNAWTQDFLVLILFGKFPYIQTLVHLFYHGHTIVLILSVVHWTQWN